MTKTPKPKKFTRAKVAITEDAKVEVKTIPNDDVTFELVDAPTDPLTLRIYGIGEWQMAVGKTHTLPLAAYNALTHTNATVKEV